MKKLLIIQILTLLISANLIYGQDKSLDHRGTSAANFLKIGVGSRAMALGGAFAAVSNDASALYWNPGGLGLLKDMEMIFSYNSWIADTKLGFVGFVFPTARYGTFGVSVYYFSSGEIEETTIYQPKGTGRSFSADDMLVGLSYGTQLTDRFSVGGTIKLVREKLAYETAQTFAVDIGSIFRTNFLNDMRIGFSLANFGGNLLFRGRDLNANVDFGKPVEASLKTNDWGLPLVFRIGLATDVINRTQHRLTASLEVDDPRDYEPIQIVGLEYALYNKAFLRGGYQFNTDETGFSAGGGMNVKIPTLGTVSLDYVYLDFGRLTSTNQFSLRIVF